MTWQLWHVWQFWKSWTIVTIMTITKSFEFLWQLWRIVTIMTIFPLADWVWHPVSHVSVGTVRTVGYRKERWFPMALLGLFRNPLRGSSQVMWYQVTKLRFVFRKQENPFLPHILTTSEEPFTASLSHLGTVLPKSRSCTKPAQRPNHAT